MTAVRITTPSAMMAIGAAAALLACTQGHADIDILDQPMWIFPGQLFRVCLKQPPGSGQLTADVPEQLTMVDTWDQDAVQRYYFRAAEPGDATLVFEGQAGRLELTVPVISWNAVTEPRQHQSIALPRIWPLDNLEFGELKQERTLHSAADLEALKGRTPSALAESWVSLSDEEIYGIIPGPSVARTCLIVLGSQEGGGVGKGCPVCGTAIYEGRSGFYPWVFDPENHPWKVGCPNCKTWFPSNDWHKGDMHSGPFPDDGFGCEPVEPVRDAKGRAWRWPFIAYYHQWEAYMRTLTPGILQTAQAYAATGDKRYAHASAVALLKYAESMVDMSLNLKHRKIPNRDGVYRWPVGAPLESRYRNLRNTFLYIQPNWDTPRMENCARAWDLIFDALGDDDALLNFARKNHHPEIRSMADFRRFIEMGVIRVPLQACIDDAVSRNYPQQEVTAATMALALGTEASMQVADWLLNARGIRFALSNEYYKDGSAHESPSYNHIQIRDMARLFDTLEQLRQRFPDAYVPPRFISPNQDPKFRLQYDFPLDFTLIGRTYAAVGDAGKAGPPNPLPVRPGYPCNQDDWINAYRVTGDQRFARAMAGPDGQSIDGLPSADLQEAAREAMRLNPAGLVLDSNILDGYGHATLRSGQGNQRRALWLRYSRVPQHAHADMLTYGLTAMQREWLPELGYPEGWTFARHWENNWGTHYGTKIVGVRAWDFDKGELTTFAGAPPFQLAAAESTVPGDPEPSYRQRTIVLVDLSPETFYAITVERVRGGTDQVFSFHGPDGPAQIDGVSMTPYEGTALGEGTEYKDLDAATADRELSCLTLMNRPSRGTLDRPWDLTYALRGQDGLNLRVTTLEPQSGELVLAKGKTPAGIARYDMTWAIIKSRGESPLTRQYLQVLQPYSDTPAVDSVERLPVSVEDETGAFEPLAFRVVAGDTVDTVILQHTPAAAVTAGGVRCNGEFGLWRTTGGDFSGAMLVRGTELRRGDASIELPVAEYQGTITACKWAENSVTIEPAPPSGVSLTGRHVRISNDHGSSASYQIQRAKITGNRCVLTFRLDPRVGEGFVKGYLNGILLGDTGLRLAGFEYYNGKTLANEDGSAWHTIRHISKGRDVVLAGDPEPPSAETLGEQFADRDGDGLLRYVIYDYGPGDRVTVENVAVVGLK